MVFVTDAAGNPVSNVAVTASIRPRFYYKGYRTYSVAASAWITIETAKCVNEDIDNNGVLSAAEDQAGNRNGRLEPGTALNITPDVRTGTDGTAVVSILYPRDRTDWLDADFTIRGQVAGSETSYVGYTSLPGLAADFNSEDVMPPGRVSPYGRADNCTDPN